MAQQPVKWLLSELPALVRKGVLSPDAAQRLAEHYGQSGGASRRPVLNTVFTVLGALLVGGGIILIFAHNWHAIPRLFRFLLLLGILVVSQALVIRAARGTAAGSGAREGSTVFSMLAFMANLALISQMYHIPTEMTDYFLICALVGLPMLYAVGSVAGSVFYFILIVAWAGAQQFTDGTAIPFWLLLAVMVPLQRRLSGEGPRRNGTLVFLWAFVLSVIAAAGMTLERALPGLWMVLYSALFSVLSLHESKSVPSEGGFWETPLKSCGIVGQAVLILMLTFDWPWRNIGWRAYRVEGGYHPAAAAFDYAFTVGMLAWALLLLVEAVRNRRRRAIVVGAAPLIVAAGFAGTGFAARGLELFAVLCVMNGYALILGADTILEGVRALRRSWLNGGTLLVVLLIVMRFFDSGMGLLVRGVGFVLVGLLFVYTNRLFARRMLKGSGE